MYKLLLVICCLTFLSSSQTVLADQEAAKKMFFEGTAKFNSGDFFEAAELFRKAYAEEPNWKLQYNIGQCESAAKRYGRSMEAFELYLAQGGDEVPQSRRVEIESEIDRLRRLVGFIEVVAPEGAIVFVNDTERGTAPLVGRLMVAASTVHDVKITHNGQEILSRSVKVSGSETITLTADPATDSATVADRSIEPTGDDSKRGAAVQRTKSQSPLVTTGIVLMATGGASVIGGVVTGVIALRKSKDLSDDCPGGVCPPDFHDENDKKKHLSTASTILFIAGGALVTAGTVLLIVGKKRNREHSVTMVPAFDGEAVGVFLSGRF